MAAAFDRDALLDAFDQIGRAAVKAGTKLQIAVDQTRRIRRGAGRDVRRVDDDDVRAAERQFTRRRGAVDARTDNNDGLHDAKGGRGRAEEGRRTPPEIIAKSKFACAG